MIIVLKNNYDKKQLERLTDWLEEMHITPQFSEGTNHTILGLVGDTSNLDEDMICALDIVESVKRIAEPYKKANRKFHPEDTVIELENGAKIGGGNLMIMAGPCSIESEEQLTEIADKLGIKNSLFGDVKDALSYAKKERCLTVICGSLYLYKDIKKV